MNPTIKTILLIMALPLINFSVHAEEALVSVDPVVKQAFTQTVPILGKLVAKQSSTVAARTSGALQNTLVQVGDRVTLGQWYGARTGHRHGDKNRIRPIFMSTLTSVFGMLPLVLFPGAGSELYRGLGSVVVGGLSLSALTADRAADDVTPDCSFGGPSGAQNSAISDYLIDS